MYRINYGNGQVSSTFGSKAAAMRELAMVDDNGFCRVQRYVGDGMWVRA